MIDDDSNNAFVLPGGKVCIFLCIAAYMIELQVFIHRGLIELLRADGELEVRALSGSPLV